PRPTQDGRREHDPGRAPDRRGPGGHPRGPAERPPGRSGRGPGDRAGDRRDRRADPADRRPAEPVPSAPGRGRPLGRGLLLVHAWHPGAERRRLLLDDRLAGHGERRVLRDRRVPVPARDAAARGQGHDARRDAGGGREHREHDDDLDQQPAAAGHGRVLHDGPERRAGFGPGSERRDRHRSVAMQITPRDKKILQIVGVALPLLLLVYLFVLKPDGGEDLASPSGPTRIAGSTGAPTESPSGTPSPTPREARAARPPPRPGETLPPVSLAGSRDPFSIPPGLELTGGSVSPTTTAAPGTTPTIPTTTFGPPPSTTASSTRDHADDALSPGWRRRRWRQSGEQDPDRRARREADQRGREREGARRAGGRQGLHGRARGHVRRQLQAREDRREVRQVPVRRPELRALQEVGVRMPPRARGPEPPVGERCRKHRRRDRGSGSRSERAASVTGPPSTHPTCSVP